MKQYGLLLDLDKCVGCYACEVACHEWHSLPEDKKWLRMRTLGPEKIDGELRMDFFLDISDECNFCEERIKENKGPFCVTTCPTQAIKFCTDNEMLDIFLNHRRCQICKLGTF